MLWEGKLELGLDLGLEEFGFTAHIRSRGEEAKAIKREAGFKARRWVVERAHSWLNRFRRILEIWPESGGSRVSGYTWSQQA